MSFSTFITIHKRATGRYYWRMFAGNGRHVADSKRDFNREDHARDNARTFVITVTNAQLRIVTVHDDKRQHIARGEERRGGLEQRINGHYLYLTGSFARYVVDERTNPARRKPECA